MGVGAGGNFAPYIGEKRYSCMPQNSDEYSVEGQLKRVWNNQYADAPSVYEYIVISMLKALTRKTMLNTLPGIQILWLYILRPAL